jgi:Ribbon-helix-helix protein, copG family
MVMVMYTSFMRRIQIYIEEQLDERLGSAAARAGVSKAALIREAVALRYGDSARLVDPLDGLVGSLDVEPGKVDDVVYGPSRRATAGSPRRRPKR